MRRVRTLPSLLGVEHPVLQAPMAGSQGSRLALAVSRAGGLGALPCAMLDAPTITAEVTAIRAATPNPFNLNFFCHRSTSEDVERQARWRESLARVGSALGVTARATAGGASREPFSEAIADHIEPLRPRVVSFHFGLPSPALVERVRGWGATILSTATTLDEALWLQDHGADAIIVQGLEAGGHRGHFLRGDLDLADQAELLALLPRVRAAVSLPVIAAGGIADAADVRRARDAGADGVQLGTAFLFTPEADTNAVHARALHHAASWDANHAGSRETTITNVFTGRPARGFVNRLVRELGPMNQDAPAFPLAAPPLVGLRAAAEAAGMDDLSPLWSGTGHARGRTQSAAELTRATAEAFASP